MNNFLQHLNEAQHFKNNYIRYNKDIDLISKEFKYNIWCLDQFDFSRFFTEGRSLANLIDSIEYEYDNLCKKKYGIYLFELLNMDDLTNYFNSRYNVRFQPYIDWIVRKEEGPYGQVNKRTRKEE